MLIDKIKDCLLPHDYIVAVWLFGSQATGRARPDSDVDIAVLAENPLNLEQRLSIQIALEDALKRFRVDVVDLHMATPVLRFEALNGQRVFVRSADEVAAFSSVVGREYESAMALLKTGYRARREHNGREKAS
jgi:predicted nucleotidyltransferase